LSRCRTRHRTGGGGCHPAVGPGGQHEAAADGRRHQRAPSGARARPRGGGIEMSSRHRPATVVVAMIIGFGFAAPLATTPPVHASEPALAVFDGFAASQSVYMEPRSNAVFALPANQLIGATHAEINSQPRAPGVTEAGGLSGGDPFRIGWSRSESKSFVENGVLHAVTASVAQDVTIAGVLHIGSVEARAETVHPGALADATGTALTVMQNVTIGGAPVTIGPAGLLVQGQPIGQAPTAQALPILDQMASHGMTSE